jgi:hypothetical protein
MLKGMYPHLTDNVSESSHIIDIQAFQKYFQLFFQLFIFFTIIRSISLSQIIGQFCEIIFWGGTRPDKKVPTGDQPTLGIRIGSVKEDIVGNGKKIKFQQFYKSWLIEITWNIDQVNFQYICMPKSVLKVKD